MLELFCKKPIFQGNDEIHQLDVIYRLMGTPTVELWPGLVDMPWYELVKPREVIRNHFREIFQKYVFFFLRLLPPLTRHFCCCRWLSPAGLDLAERLLAFDPVSRATATQALEAPYFHQEDPPPSRPSG